MNCDHSCKLLVINPRVKAEVRARMSLSAIKNGMLTIRYLYMSGKTVVVFIRSDLNWGELWRKVTHLFYRSLGKCNQIFWLKFKIVICCLLIDGIHILNTWYFHILSIFKPLFNHRQSFRSLYCHTPCKSIVQLFKYILVILCFWYCIFSEFSIILPQWLNSHHLLINSSSIFILFLIVMHVVRGNEYYTSRYM